MTKLWCISSGPIITTRDTMRRRFKTEELKGRKFNYLTLIEVFSKPVKGGKNRKHWKCRCDCGNIVERREDYLWQGKTHSCGCMHPRMAKEWGKAQWKGHGKLNGQYFSMLRWRTEKLKIPFDVSIEYLWELFEKQGGKCALTGLPIEFNTQKAQRNGKEQTASLDRIDSKRNIGYVPGNVQWVHKDVNRMKNAYPLDRFKEICRLVTEYQPEMCHEPCNTGHCPWTAAPGLPFS